MHHAPSGPRARLVLGANIASPSNVLAEAAIIKTVIAAPERDADEMQAQSAIDKAPRLFGYREPARIYCAFFASLSEPKTPPVASTRGRLQPALYRHLRRFTEDREAGCNLRASPRSS
jgi:hypothetical protein